MSRPAFAGACLLSVLLGAFVIGLDCFLEQSQDLVPNQSRFFLASWRGWLFCLGFGSISGIAFAASEIWPDYAFAKVLSLEQKDPAIRAITCGLSALVIIRSKLLEGGKNRTPIGGELFYVWVKRKLFRSLRRSLMAAKEAAILAHPDVYLSARLAEDLRARVEYEYPDEPGIVARFNEMMRPVLARRPVTPFDASDPEWRTFCYNVALVGADYVDIGAALISLGRAKEPDRA